MQPKWKSLSDLHSEAHLSPPFLDTGRRKTVLDAPSSDSQSRSSSPGKPLSPPPPVLTTTPPTHTTTLDRSGSLSYEKADLDSRMVAKLVKGGTFLKHGRRGEPHSRYVCCSADLNAVRWGKNLEEAKASGSSSPSSSSRCLLSSELKHVLAGHNTTNFTKKKATRTMRTSRLPTPFEAEDGRAFSLVFQVKRKLAPSRARYLDLEADSQEERDQWVTAFCWLMDHMTSRSAETKVSVVKVPIKDTVNASPRKFGLNNRPTSPSFPTTISFSSSSFGSGVEINSPYVRKADNWRRLIDKTKAASEHAERVKLAVQINDGPPAKKIAWLQNKIKEIDKTMERDKEKTKKIEESLEQIVSDIDGKITRYRSYCHFEKVRALEECRQMTEVAYRMQAELCRKRAENLKKSSTQFSAFLQKLTPSTRLDPGYFVPIKDMAVDADIDVLMTECWRRQKDLEAANKKYEKASRKVQEEESVDRAQRFRELIDKFYNHYDRDLQGKFEPVPSLEEKFACLILDSRTKESKAIQKWQATLRTKQKALQNVPPSRRTSLENSFVMVNRPESLRRASSTEGTVSDIQSLSFSLTPSTASASSSSSSSSSASTSSASSSSSASASTVNLDSSGSALSLEPNVSSSSQLNSSLLISASTPSSPPLKRTISTPETDSDLTQAAPLTPRLFSSPLNIPLPTGTKRVSAESEELISGTPPASLIVPSSGVTRSVSKNNLDLGVSSGTSDAVGAWHSFVHAYIQTFSEYLITEYKMQSERRPFVRRLLERVLFPDIWKSCLEIMYEETETKNEQLTSQLPWLRELSLRDMGVLEKFTPQTESEKRAPRMSIFIPQNQQHVQTSPPSEIGEGRPPPLDCHHPSLDIARQPKAVLQLARVFSVSPKPLSKEQIDSLPLPQVGGPAVNSEVRYSAAENKIKEDLARLSTDLAFGEMLQLTGDDPNSSEGESEGGEDSNENSLKEESEGREISETKTAEELDYVTVTKESPKSSQNEESSRGVKEVDTPLEYLAPLTLSRSHSGSQVGTEGFPPRRLQHEQAESLPAVKPYQNCIDIIQKLAHINVPGDMCECIVAAAKAIYRRASDYAVARAGKKYKASDLGADEFFPIWTYVLVHADFTDLCQRVALMRHHCGDDDGEGGYYLTCLEGALAHLLEATPEKLKRFSMCEEPFLSEKPEENPNLTAAVEEKLEERTEPLISEKKEKENILSFNSVDGIDFDEDLDPDPDSDMIQPMTPMKKTLATPSTAPSSPLATVTLLESTNFGQQFELSQAASIPNEGTSKPNSPTPAPEALAAAPALMATTSTTSVATTPPEPLSPQQNGNGSRSPAHGMKRRWMSGDFTARPELSPLNDIKQFFVKKLTRPRDSLRSESANALLQSQSTPASPQGSSGVEHSTPGFPSSPLSTISESTSPSSSPAAFSPPSTPSSPSPSASPLSSVPLVLIS